MYIHTHTHTHIYIYIYVYTPVPIAALLRRRSAAARLLRSWVRIPPGAWIFVCCKCCLLSGRGLCDELITRPEESYRMWFVVVCDLETSRMRRPWPTGGCCDKNKHTYIYIHTHTHTHTHTYICIYISSAFVCSKAVRQAGRQHNLSVIAL